MGSTFGKNIKITLFGESHGPLIGLSVDNFPCGVEIDIERINEFLFLRSSANPFSTPRKEKDEVKFVSGVYQGKTTGTPLTFFITNGDVKSSDYHFEGFRPNHADYTGFIKYQGFNDPRGGGHFSGRLTAPLVVLGAICSSQLEKQGIIIGSHIFQIGDYLESITNPTPALLKLFNDDFLPTSNPDLVSKIIDKVRKDGDSIGASIETFVLNLPVGIGEPFFDTIEGILAHALFAIPGVKGVEFGQGFNFAQLKGSQANDSFICRDDRIQTASNNCGGILGGITNGMPLVIKTVFKPTPSISLKQITVNVQKEEVDLQIKGRHDAIIALRGRIVIDSLVAFCLFDLMQGK